MRTVLDALCRRYVAAAESDAEVSVPDDPKGATDVVDRIGQATELTCTDRREPGNRADALDRDGGIDPAAPGLLPATVRIL